MKRRYWIWMISMICLLFLCACEQQPAVHTVTIDYDYLGEREEQTVAAGEKIAEPTDAPTKIGYENLGWFVQENGAWRAWDFATDTVTGDVTLLLRREAIQTTLELVWNDGSDKSEKLTMTYGEPFELPIPEREGYTFMGWYFANTRQPERGVWQGTEATFHMAKWTVFAPGTMVSLGTYEQDGDKTNRQEPIEWLLVDKNADGSAYLLISRYILDWVPYDASRETCAWQDASLRTWLNQDFYQAAFHADEQKYILLANLEDIGTTDRLFLPHEAERDLMFEYEYLAGLMTESVTAKKSQIKGGHGGTVGGYAATPYWMRDASGKCLVTLGISSSPNDANDSSGLRPAMWVDAAYVDGLLEK